MNANAKQHRAILQSIAHRAMLERGLLPDFSAEAIAELGKIQALAAARNAEFMRDLTNLLWASIDNDDSRDLDQLTVAEAMLGDKIKILVAIADVDSLVKNGDRTLRAGEYIAELPSDTALPTPLARHFGLAVKDYAHSAAPNRRYPDLITQRLLKAALAGSAWPYSKDELDALAKHCTEEEDAANKVERQVGKSAAALLLESRIGERFDAIVTGASDKGTWARLLNIPVEGKLVHGFEGLDVGDRIRVQLTSINVERGFIDFKKVGPSRR